MNRTYNILRLPKFNYQRLSRHSACLTLLLLISCSRHNCEVNYVYFEGANKAPFVYISSQKEKCVYNVKVDFWMDGKGINSTGQLWYRDEAFYVKIDSFDNSDLRFFDFSRAPGDEYSIRLDLHSKQSESKIIVDKIVKRQDGLLVYIFRLKDGFLSYESEGDMVFFVTRENGVIGSYISNFDDGVELVISERGDILLNELNYNEKEFRTIE